jgi:DNA-binding transcriptional regulator YhcF (GntR family)
METPVKVVVDLSKPKGERESIIPLTAEEIAEREAMAIEAQAEQDAREAEQQAKAEAKASAISKLTALGLTEEEALALVGA